MRVLMIEAGKAAIPRLRKGLEESGFIVDVAADARHGALYAADRHYAAAIASIGRSIGSGDNLIRCLRRKNARLPVLVVLEGDSVNDRVVAFDSGADGVVSRSATVEEVLARLHSLRRRTAQESRGRVLRVGDLELDRIACRVTRGGETLPLTLKEYSLLCVLVERRGAVLSREFLVDQVWSRDVDRDLKVVDVAISRLRSKIHHRHRSPLLHTVRGVGYILDFDDSWSTA